MVFAALATTVGLLALVFANVLLGQAGFTQADLENSLAAKRSAVEQLQIDVARLSAPGRIAARAAKLGLVVATDVTVLAPGAATSSPGGPRLGGPPGAARP